MYIIGQLHVLGLAEAAYSTRLRRAVNAVLSADSRSNPVPYV
ncbi:hypothetical protein [uncultured Corynebacterium sp.]|nr:hypothetical protein [uncultured Corynebacterium sp.]